jgi:hypothetical protein
LQAEATIKDSLVAATALRHKLTVATRHVFDFEKAGCKVVNPARGLTPEDSATRRVDIRRAACYTTRRGEGP